MEAPSLPQQRPWLTVCESVYYQADGSSPTIAESRFMRLLVGEEQPYSRTFRVGQQWKELDAGWLAECGSSLLTLANEMPQWQVVPTAEEKAEAAARQVELALAGEEAGQWTSPPRAFALLRPGESVRFEPLNLSALRLRCRSGETRVTLTLLPP